MFSIPSLIAISSTRLSATINPLGAELFELQESAGRDILWDGRPPFWPRRAPLLFPIVGRLVNDSYSLGGRCFRLPQHGFARSKVFALGAISACSVTFRLTSDDDTFKQYPFRFALDVTFSIDANSLLITANIKNAGDVDMPASFGFHPALRWPLDCTHDRGECFIEFSQDESAPIRRLRNGLLIEHESPSPVVNKRLLLRDALFADDALIFDRIESQRVWYGNEGSRQIQIDFPETPYLGIWTQPGAGFICIEPWHGLSDPEDFEGDLCAKPGIVLIGPHDEFQCTMAITIRD